MENMQRRHEIPYSEDMKDIYCFFDKNDINKLRISAQNSYSIAQWLQPIFEKSGYLCTILLFEEAWPVGDFRIDSIRVKDELHNRIDNVMHPSVVFFGEFIVDAFYSDKILRTKNYIEQLEQLNDDSEITILSQFSHWYDVDGKSYVLTLENLKNYKFRKDVKNYAYRTKY